MACSTTLTGITLDCRDSVGGLSELYIAAAATSIEFTTGVSGNTTAVTNIELNGTALTADLSAMEAYELSRETANVAESGAFSNENGTAFYTQVLNAVFNKMTAAKQAELFELAKSNRLLIIVKDNNDTYWMVGNEKGCIVTSSEGGSGTAFGDRNGVTIGFTGISKAPMYTVTGISFG